MTTEREYRAAQKRAPRRRSPRRILTRIGNVLLGLVFLLLGVLLIRFPESAWSAHHVSYVAIMSMVGVGAFIGLFGADMAWRYAWDVPTSRSFFMRALTKLSSKTSPGHLLFAVAAVALLSLAIGAATGRKIEIEFGRTALLAWLALHLQILGHEYGHFFAAQAVGYRPFRVVGGAFGFSARDGRWAAHANRDWRFLLGGAVFASIPQGARRWSSDFLFAAGGPLASALLLFVCIRLDAIIGGVPVASELLQLNIQIAILALIVNLVPFRLRSTVHGTDGYQLLQLLRNR
jgi:hypothetical protein